MLAGARTPLLSLLQKYTNPPLPTSILGAPAAATCSNNPGALRAVMGKSSLLSLACALLLWHVPLAQPLVVGVRPRLAATTRAEVRARSSPMMSTPSTPVPRNIKDTVSCLRAAVQVWCSLECCHGDRPVSSFFAAVLRAFSSAGISS